MNGFIECTQIGKAGVEFRKLIPISEIISVTEIDGETFIQMERDRNGNIRVGVRVAESFEKIQSLILGA